MTVEHADEPVTQPENTLELDAQADVPADAYAEDRGRTPFTLDIREQPTVIHPSGVLLRVATPEDDPTVAQFYFDMWADYNMTALLTEQWLEQTLAFIAHARDHLDYSAFIAETPPADTMVANVASVANQSHNRHQDGTHQQDDAYQDGTHQQDDAYQDGTHQQDNAQQQTDTAPRVLGVAACQRFVGLYPWVFTPEKRSHGYIWGVRVVPEARQRGIARLLVTACGDYLKELGCHRVRLHAASQGKSLYEKMGFTLGNEMVLELDQPAFETSE